MFFISTRGSPRKYNFVNAFLCGLADDGGLLIPEHIPTISDNKLSEWSNLSYTELMYQIFWHFVDSEIPRDDLREIIYTSYERFRNKEVVTVRKINGIYVLELFHGPTFAFKDLALQFMGSLYSYVAEKYNRKINILGATSGDTGSAAIHAVISKPNIRICILHPYEKVSKIQELQMTTVESKNVSNLAVKGNFDDCQKIVKGIFADVEFKTSYSLRAINSINIVRILAQTVYYFYSYFRTMNNNSSEKVHFSVPTGNFGNILSGFLAKKMGLPIRKLILATNKNNILERFINTGIYKPGQFKSTYSPAMDIQIASNFERYLYYLVGEDTTKVYKMMEHFSREGKLSVPKSLLKKVQEEFYSKEICEELCLNTIKKYHKKYHYLIDPHTACGIAAFECLKERLNNKEKTSDGKSEKCICLATAHAAKFDEAIKACGIKQSLPKELKVLAQKRKRRTVIENSKEKVTSHIASFFK